MFYQKHDVEDVLKNGGRDITSGRLVFCGSKVHETIGKPLPERHPQSPKIIENLGSLSKENHLKQESKVLVR